MNIKYIIITILIAILCFMSGVKRNSNISMDKIYSIESSNNPNAVNPSGAKGYGQLMKKTWEDCVKEMGKNWNYDTDWMNKEKNKSVSEYYMNTKIPKMLKHYGIPDEIDTRLAAYNWGIGNLNNCYKEYKENWKKFIPQETKNYIIKYRR